MAKFRVGIIGCGGIARTAHFPAYHFEKRSEVVALCDIVDGRAEKYL